MTCVTTLLLSAGVCSTSLPVASAATCKLDAQHPSPVLLLHGTWSSKELWKDFGPALVRQGFCVFSVNYGKDTSSSMGARPNTFGTAPVLNSARQVSNYVADILESTGSKKVSLVTHSQGGLIAKLITHIEGAASAYDTVVTLASTAGGTDGRGTAQAAGLVGAGPGSVIGDLAAGIVGQAALDQIKGSPLMDSVSELPDTVEGVRYLAVVTNDDGVATPPYQAGFLDKSGPSREVWNVDVRDCLPKEAPPVGHSGIVNLPATQSLVMWALSHGPGSPRC